MFEELEDWEVMSTAAEPMMRILGGGRVVGVGVGVGGDGGGFFERERERGNQLDASLLRLSSAREKKKRRFIKISHPTP